MVCGTKCPGCVSRWLHLGQALFQWSEGPFNIRDWRWDQWHFQNFLFPTFYSAVLRDFGMLGPQVFCLVMSVNELLQDLGALFLLYTSVGDAEGVLNTGKLAEAGAVMTNDAFFLQLFNVLVFFFCMIVWAHRAVRKATLATLLCFATCCWAKPNVPCRPNKAANFFHTSWLIAALFRVVWATCCFQVLINANRLPEVAALVISFSWDHGKLVHHPTFRLHWCVNLLKVAAIWSQ